MMENDPAPTKAASASLSFVTGTVELRGYGVTTVGTTLAELIEHAIALINQPFWKGPKPRSGDKFTIWPVGGDGPVDILWDYPNKRPTEAERPHVPEVHRH